MYRTKKAMAEKTLQGAYGLGFWSPIHLNFGIFFSSMSLLMLGSCGGVQKNSFFSLSLTTSLDDFFRFRSLGHTFFIVREEKGSRSEWETGLFSLISLHFFLAGARVPYPQGALGDADALLYDITVWMCVCVPVFYVFFSFSSTAYPSKKNKKKMKKNMKQPLQKVSERYVSRK